MNKLNKKVLVVEDEPPMRKALVERLGKEGFDVLEESNGQAGLETALKEHPDLILLDIVLPKMDGMAVLKKIREDEWGKNALVIILTNISANEKINEAMEGGAYYYLIKSDWEIDDLIKEIMEKMI